MIIKDFLEQFNAPLALSAVEKEYSIPTNTRNLIIGVAASFTDKHISKGALLSYKFFDSEDNVCIPTGSYSVSPRFGTFFYVDLPGTEKTSEQYTVHSIGVPPGAKSIMLTGVEWIAGMKTVVHELRIVPLDDSGFGKTHESALPHWITERTQQELKKPWAKRSTSLAKREPGNSPESQFWSIEKEIVARPKGLAHIDNHFRPVGAKLANKVRVAIICDEFTYNSFSPEFESLVLLPQTWREQVEEFQPDIFLCESAWSGVDSQTRPWRGMIYNSIKFTYENRKVLFEILNYMKSKSIPSVFWNKEDPTHFPDRVNDFVSTAARFDFVLTTAEEVVPDYCKFLPDNRVGVLQFAAQPRTFNPLGIQQRQDGAVFAGAWYNVHKERSRTMHHGFKYILDSGLQLTIHDRNYGNKEDLRFPDEYSAFIKPPVNHLATANLYRNHSIGLNFNTVVNSKTMFARRVFELAASGTTVVSNFSPGIERIYGNDVIYFDRDERLLHDYDVEERRKKTMNALNTTLSEHTYRHRFEEILSFIGMPFTSVRENPTMVCRISTHEEAESALSFFKNKMNIFSRLLIVVSAEIATSQTGSYMTRYMSKMVTVIAESLLLKEDVPTSNYVQTSDLIWVDPDLELKREMVHKVLLHGEYTHNPVVLSDRKDIGWGANAICHGMRISALDIKDAILSPETVRPTLEVPR